MVYGTQRRKVAKGILILRYHNTIASALLHQFDYDATQRRGFTEEWHWDVDNGHRRSVFIPGPSTIGLARLCLDSVAQIWHRMKCDSGPHMNVRGDWHAISFVGSPHHSRHNHNHHPYIQLSFSYITQHTPTQS